MFKIISLLVILPQILLADAVIFSGSDVKALKSNLDLNGGAKILSSTTDPTASAVSAPIGSILLNTTNGNSYRKLDAGSSTNWQRVGTGSGQSGNTIVNPDWETVTTSWTASGGTYTTTSTNPAEGVKSATWDSNGASQTFTSSTVAVPAGLFKRNIYGKCLVKAASAATHLFQIYDGTNVLASQTITSSTDYVEVGVTAIGPSSGNFVLRFVSVAADEPLITIDSCYLGENYKVGTVAQASVVATLTYPFTTSCNWSQTSTTFADFASDSDCPTATVTGLASAPGTKVPHMVVNNLSPGDYLLIVNGTFQDESGSTSSWRITDGTTHYTSNTTPNENKYFAPRGVRFAYTTAQSSVTFKIQCQRQTSGDCRITNDTSLTSDMSFYLYRFPTINEVAIQYDQLPGSWSGYHATDCAWTTTSATFAAFSADASCTFTERQNNNFGTVASTGAKTPGISFTPKRAGKFFVCVNATVYVTGSTGNWALNLLGPASTVITGSSGTHNTNTLGAGAVVTTCGIINATTVATTEITIQGKTSGGTLNLTDVSTKDAELEWSIFSLDQAIPAPILTGSVLNNSSTESFRMVSAEVTNTGAACNITSQKGSWISTGTRNGTGDCTWPVTSGVFSVSPDCLCTPSVDNSTGSARTCYFQGTKSTTSIRAFTTDGGSASDKKYDIICFGQR